MERPSLHTHVAGAEIDFNRVILVVPKSGFKERRRPSSAAEIAAVSVRDNLFWVRPPSRQVCFMLVVLHFTRLNNALLAAPT